MPRHTRRKSASRSASSASLRAKDVSSWSFIIFLTLAFILLVVVLTIMKGTVLDLRTKAGLSCPVPSLPRAEDCPGGEWKYKRANDGCQAFFCEAPAPTTAK